MIKRKYLTWSILGELTLYTEVIGQMSYESYQCLV